MQLWNALESGVGPRGWEPGNGEMMWGHPCFWDDVVSNDFLFSALLGIDDPNWLSFSWVETISWENVHSFSLFRSRRMGLSFGSREFIWQPQKPRIATPRFKALSVLEVAFPPEAALGWNHVRGKKTWHVTVMITRDPSTYKAGKWNFVAWQLRILPLMSGSYLLLHVHFALRHGRWEMCGRLAPKPGGFATGVDDINGLLKVGSGLLKPVDSEMRTVSPLPKITIRFPIKPL